MGKGRIVHFGFAGVSQIFQAEPVHYRRNPGIQNHLRNIAINHGLASLSSPMVGESWKALIILKKQFLQHNKWNQYAKLRHTSYDAFLNPSIVDHSQETLEEWEECCGYPGIKLLISRAKKIMVSYKTEQKFMDTNMELLDFPARVFQHQMDHIQCIDPLKLALKLQIIDPVLREKHQQTIQSLFLEMSQRREEGKLKGESLYKRWPAFNELRREIAFTLTEHYRT